MRIRQAILAGASALALLGGTAALAGTAQAIPLPSCTTTDPGPGSPPNYVPSQHCWYNTDIGNAGYLGANDNHTHYRYVTADVANSPSLVDLNGTGGSGTVGTELCDPNDHAGGHGGWAAEIGLFGNGGVAHQSNMVFYAAGFWASGAPDPCANNLPLVTDPNSTTNCPPGGTGSVFGTSPAVFCGSLGTVNPGDQLDNLAVYYVPPTWASHKLDISFGFCDVTGGFCRQAYTHKPVVVNLWEFGIGAFSENTLLGNPPITPMETFGNTMVTCYACAHAVPIIDVQPVNGLGIGGLVAGQTTNGSGNATMSPFDNGVPSLTASGFTDYYGPHI
jgi:hypothetical protein